MLKDHGERPLSRSRAREMGINIGRLPTGTYNAITDVAGVLVGHATIVSGEGPLVVGQGPVRTGVTVVLPSRTIGHGEAGHDAVFAGYHVLNGAGEMTGMAWIVEVGILSTPIALTNTHSVGVVRDALVAYSLQQAMAAGSASVDLRDQWFNPVVAETWDGALSDINGMHVEPEHVAQALAEARGGPIAEGCVGGGTGMICHGFKGGIGTSSRVVADGWTVGVLVQANHGLRELLRVDGVPVGREIGADAVPLPGAAPPAGSGSIIGIVATDAPLLPTQCRRLAQRASLGIARAGGLGENGSGDLFLAFSTANDGLHETGDLSIPLTVSMLRNRAMNVLFEAVVDATEEAIVNALCMATTTTGIDGRIAYELPLDRLQEVMTRYAGAQPTQI
jgi:D-aminopeptidase